MAESGLNQNFLQALIKEPFNLMPSIRTASKTTADDTRSTIEFPIAMEMPGNLGKGDSNVEKGPQKSDTTKQVRAARGDVSKNGGEAATIVVKRKSEKRSSSESNVGSSKRKGVVAPKIRPAPTSGSAASGLAAKREPVAIAAKPQQQQEQQQQQHDFLYYLGTMPTSNSTDVQQCQTLMPFVLTPGFVDLTGENGFLSEDKNDSFKQGESVKKSVQGRAVKVEGKEDVQTDSLGEKLRARIEAFTEDFVSTNKPIQVDQSKSRLNLTISLRYV